MALACSCLNAYPVGQYAHLVSILSCHFSCQQFVSTATRWTGTPMIVLQVISIPYQTSSLTIFFSPLVCLLCQLLIKLFRENELMKSFSHSEFCMQASSPSCKKKHQRFSLFGDDIRKKAATGGFARKTVWAAAENTLIGNRFQRFQIWTVWGEKETNSYLNGLSTIRLSRRSKLIFFCLIYIAQNWSNITWSYFVNRDKNKLKPDKNTYFRFTAFGFTSKAVLEELS